MMTAALWDLLFFAIALGILVTVHEAGHFFAARVCGVKVLRFSIGFGKVLFQKTGKDGCEYALSLIPLGGYVKMQGENDDDDDEGSFKRQGVVARAFIIAAGPLCNIILTFILFVVINLSGVLTLKPVVDDVIPGSSAQEAGVQPQSLITMVNGEEVRSWGDVILSLGIDNGNTKIKLETKPFLGSGKAGSYELTAPSKIEISSGVKLLECLGIRRMVGRITNRLTSIKSGSPADLAGIRTGDEIVAVNGVDTPTWYRVYDAIRASDGGELTLLIKREGQIYETKLTPSFYENKAEHRQVPMIGVMTEAESIPELEDTISYGPIDAMRKAFTDTRDMSTLVIQTVVKMISGAISPENVSGPIAIAKGAGDSASAGVVAFLSFLAAISVNLGILNLLPIPILDGGQLVFIAYEALFRRAPGQKVQHALTAIGLGILLSLMMLAVFNDFRGL